MSARKEAADISAQKIAEADRTIAGRFWLHTMSEYRLWVYRFLRDKK